MLSARNQFEGTIRSITLGTVMAEVIIAVGTSGNPLVQATTPDLKTTDHGYIQADEATLKTSKRGVFAAGDVRSGANRRVAAAVGEGSATIHSVHRYLLTV